MSQLFTSIYVLLMFVSKKFYNSSNSFLSPCGGWKNYADFCSYNLLFAYRFFDFEKIYAGALNMSHIWKKVAEVTILVKKKKNLPFNNSLSICQNARIGALFLSLIIFSKIFPNFPGSAGDTHFCPKRSLTESLTCISLQSINAD